MRSDSKGGVFTYTSSEFDENGIITKPLLVMLIIGIPDGAGKRSNGLQTWTIFNEFSFSF